MISARKNKNIFIFQNNFFNRKNLTNFRIMKEFKLQLNTFAKQNVRPLVREYGLMVKKSIVLEE